MTDQQLLQELETILEASGISVRHESLDDSPGGLCTLNGRRFMFLDAHAPPATQARACARVVKKKVDIDTIYLKPEVREYLENRAEEG